MPAPLDQLTARLLDAAIDRGYVTVIYQGILFLALAFLAAAAARFSSAKTVPATSFNPCVLLGWN